MTVDRRELAGRLSPNEPPVRQFFWIVGDNRNLIIHISFVSVTGGRLAVDDIGLQGFDPSIFATLDHHVVEVSDLLGRRIRFPDLLIDSEV